MTDTARPVTTPALIDNHELIDSLLQQWAGALGADLRAYRNHVYRVVNLACAQLDADSTTIQTLAIAGVFHDLGIWSDADFDYLEPSVARARQWLEAHDRAALAPAVAAIIRNHHKIRRYRGTHQPLVEAFRRADWADVSLGALRAGLPRGVYARVRRHFPNAGFHARLAQLAGQQLRRHPLRPLPMMRW